MSDVVKCPKCGESFDQSYDYTWCSECGEYFSEEFIKTKIPKLAASIASMASRTTSAAGPAEARPGSSVVNRYRDAYRVGAALVGIGNAVKVIGGVLGGIIALGSLRSGNGPFGSSAIVAGIFLAAVVGVLFWVIGVIVAAQGQILQATIDTAVASSRFLSDGERADAMGLSRGVADRSARGRA